MHACMHCAVRKQSQQQQHAKQCAGQVYGGVKCILSRDLLIPPAISCYFFIFVFFLLNCDREYNEWMVFISERKTWSEEEFVSCSVASGKKTPRQLLAAWSDTNRKSIPVENAAYAECVVDFTLHALRATVAEMRSFFVASKSVLSSSSSFAIHIFFLCFGFVIVNERRRRKSQS